MLSRSTSLRVLVLLSVAPILPVRGADAATDPRLSSWLTAPSARYARLFATDAAKAAGTASTTWSRGQGVQSSPSYAGVMQVAASASWVYVRSSGLGYHTMGPWYLDAARTQNFPNFPANQNVLYRIPRTPVEAATKTLTPGGAIGYGVDGVALFDGRDTFSYSTVAGQDATPVNGVTGGGVWNRDAYVNEGVTFDAALAHQAGANYHYHANTPALRHQLGDHVDYVAATKTYTESAAAPTRHSPIIGWMADGFPVYGPYGYAVPTDPASGVRRMVPGYVKRDGTNGTTLLAATGRTTLPAWAATAQGRAATLTAAQTGPAVSTAYPLGRYLEDYDYLGHLGKTQGTDFDLDLHNGRHCVTPEFPGGTYAYFLAIEADGTPKFPYIIGRWFYGTPSGGNVGSITETVTEHVRSGPATAIAGTATAAGGGVALAWDSVEGATYRIEASADNAAWTTVAAAVTSAGARTTTTAATAAAFFRITVSAIATYDTRAVVGTPVGTSVTLSFASTATAPTITVQPGAQAVAAGGTATFAVTASGTAPLSYQWYRDTTPVDGATAATLTLNAVTAAMAGSYAVVVSNSAGTATSAAATLTVNVGATAPTITVPSTAVAVPPGGAATLTVVATGTAPLCYQWLKDGAVVAGATAATLGFPAVQGSDGALYAVRVSNAAGSATSAAAELTVASAGHAVFGAGYYAGGTVTLVQTATFSGAPVQVTWQLLLPAGWSVAAETSTGAASKPAAGTKELAEWSWTTVPASPVTFRCTLSVPAGTTRAAAVSAGLTVRRGDG